MRLWLMCIGAGVAAIMLGAKGFSAEGLPLVGDRRISGTGGKIVGTLCCLAGLGFIAFALAGIQTNAFDSVGPYRQDYTQRQIQEQQRSSNESFARNMRSITEDTQRQLAEESRRKLAELIGSLRQNEQSSRSAGSREQQSGPPTPDYELLRALEEARRAQKAAIVYEGTGRWLEALREFEAAALVLEHAAAVDPTKAEYQRQHAEVLYSVGLTSSRLGRSNASLQAFQTAASLYEQLQRSKPRNADDDHWLGGAHCNAAHAFRRDGNCDEAAIHYNAAIAVLQQHLRSNPTCATATRYLRNAFWGRGENGLALRDWNSAALDLSEALKLDPKPSEIHRQRGFAWAEAGHWKEAAQDFRACSRSTTPESGDWYHWALAAAAAGDFAGYQAACRDMLAKYTRTKDSAAANLTAWTAAATPDATDDYAPYIALARQSAAAQPESPAFRRTLGAILFRAGELHEAVRELEKASDLRGDDVDPQEQLFVAMAHRALRDPVKAKSCWDAAIEATAEILPEAGATPEPIPWDQRIEAQLLQEEAQLVISKSEVAS